MFPLIGAILLAISAAPEEMPKQARASDPAAGSARIAKRDTCAEARASYESLSLERAVEVADVALAKDPGNLACLEIKGLSLLVLGQMDRAHAVLDDLFLRSPDYPIKDPSLSPALKEAIDGVRENARTLSAVIHARWLIRDALRIDVVLEGGLRDAAKVRYRAQTKPAPLSQTGLVDILGRVASATIAVGTASDVRAVRVSGSILNPGGRAVTHFETELQVPNRPKGPDPERVIVEVDRGGFNWPVWVGVGLAAIGAAVVIGILAQPRLPDTAGTVGRAEIQ